MIARLLETTTKGARRHPRSALLSVLPLLAAGVWATVALAARGQATPDILGQPPGVTAASSATFAYTDSEAVRRFECRLDGGAYRACGTRRPSTRTYDGLPAGTHTFAVRAVTRGGTSGAASYTWTVDPGPPGRPPTLQSLDRTDPSPTNRSPLHWTARFSAPVRNVAAEDFGIAKSGVTGSPSVASAAPVGGPAPQRLWVVTVSTAGVAGGPHGRIRLSLVAKGAIQSAYGTGLGGRVPVSGDAYAFDTTPPAAPRIVDGPDAYSSSRTARFAIAGFGGAALACSLDGAPFSTCRPSPRYAGLADGGHTLRVEAVDAAGNKSAPASWSWTVDTVPPTVRFDGTPPNPDRSTSPSFSFGGSDAGSGLASIRCRLDGGAWAACTSPRALSGLSFAAHTFSIQGVDRAGNTSAVVSDTWSIERTTSAYTLGIAPLAPLYPGATAQPVDVTFRNPNGDSVRVSSLGVRIVSITDARGAEISDLGGGSGACPAGDYEVAGFSGTPFEIPPGASSLQSLAIPQSRWPRVRWIDSATRNQDACQAATIHFSLTGAS